jgi:hypothetical protein
MSSKAEAAMDGAFSTCYDEKPAWILPKDPWPSGGFILTNRIGAKPGLIGGLDGLGKDLKEQRVLRVSRLYPAQVGSRHEERKTLAGFLPGSGYLGRKSEELAEVIEVRDGLGHDRTPIPGGGGPQAHRVEAGRYC